MSNKSKIKLKRLIEEAAKIINNEYDSKINDLLGTGILQVFMESIDPPKIKKGQNIYEYLLENNIVSSKLCLG